MSQKLLFQKLGKEKLLSQKLGKWEIAKRKLLSQQLGTLTQHFGTEQLLGKNSETEIESIRLTYFFDFTLDC